MRLKHYVMIPFGDMFNHPSVSALKSSGEAGERFSQRSISATCIDVKTIFSPGDADGGNVSLLAPTTDLLVKEGDEVWMWYGNAGYGSQTRGEWDAKEAEFRFSYGFSPWD